MAQTTKGRRYTAGDREIAHRIRDLRIKRGMTQQLLADRLGISSAQVQKYEYGIDRISASRLKEMSDIFRVSIDYFFDQAKTYKARKQDPAQSTDSDYVSHLVKLFSEIKNVKHRRAVIRLLKEIADD